MSTNRLTDEQVGAILGSGAFYRLDDYALRDALLPKIRATFLEGIESLAGPECRRKVEADGLGQMHRHFPLAKIHRLEAHLMRALQDELYYWSYRVGADTLGLPDPFYVDHLIVFRIHYPFLQAREARDIEPAPVLWKERMRLAVAALRDWDTLRGYVGSRVRAGRDGPAATSRHDPYAYHGDMPVPARSHGPHIDTWYGHSYDGINLWLSIEGVNVDNTVIIYPDMFGRPISFDPVSMYLASGIEIGKPLKVELRPGQLLVFNPEMLHGTQVNISDETRVALTTRINPGAPRFGGDAPFFMEHWYSSEDLRRRDFGRPRRFAHEQHRGGPSIVPRAPYEGNRTIRLRHDGDFPAGGPVAVCASGVLEPGYKVAVDVGRHAILLWRTSEGIRAFSRRCPHLGIDVADGYHDEREVFCPGHGIAYSLADGRSKCAAFRLREYRAYERDGTVYVERPEAGAPEPATAPAAAATET